MKKLLSEVLGYEVSKVEFVKPNDAKVFYKDGHAFRIINTYELAHVCKEWAFELGFELMSFKYDINEWAVFINYDRQDVNKRYVSDTEPGAIFKVCERIQNENN